ncbi:uracil-DNA glycosylase family protein [Sedimentibacter sp.]|uniref:uracil-DNA glycosylase family protein n=1 Tax=Sedimentibacter sp. TaxID=1960295 RepID=UPI0028B06EBE|nr:uracil-DNA glycosylase family protein [Sedimentibacter sp.]
MYSNKFNKYKKFNMLLNSVHNCTLCSRMCNRKKVLSELNGNLNSKVLFIAEAPGRLGAECTGIPLLGDKTGENFESLLRNIGWKREDIFITNSILCNPQDESGNNSTPTIEEIKNCSNYLQMTINVINPDVIVTLGVKALESLKHLCLHNFKLKEDVGKCLNWEMRNLVPLYHMGPRALIHRPIIKQRGDFIALSHIVDPLNGLKKHKSINNSNIKITQDNMSLKIIKYIIKRFNEISMFKLTKIMYLADYNSYLSYGSTISNFTYLRMQEGPWIPILKDIIKNLEGNEIKVEFKKQKPLLIYKNYEDFNIDAELDEVKLNILNEIIEKYMKISDKVIKIAAYRTEPMKYILEQESKGRKMLKIPVIYNNKLVMELDSKENI